MYADFENIIVPNDVTNEENDNDKSYTLQLQKHALKDIKLFASMMINSQKKPKYIAEKMHHH